MTREQMVAWLILEGWEYHQKGSGILSHAARNMRMMTTGVRRGELVVLYDDTEKVYGSGTTHGEPEDYDRSFDTAPEPEVKRIYNKLQEIQK